MPVGLQSDENPAALNEYHLDVFPSLEQKSTIDKNTSKAAISEPSEPHIQETDTSFFVCQFCPYFSLAKKTLLGHVNDAHLANSVSKLAKLQCPACPNIFYHEVSLRSHLSFDHYLYSGELDKVIEIIQKKKDSNIVNCSVTDTEDKNKATDGEEIVNKDKIIVCLDEGRQQKHQFTKLLELTRKEKPLIDINVVTDPLTNEISFLEASTGNKEDTLHSLDSNMGTNEDLSASVFEDDNATQHISMPIEINKDSISNFEYPKAPKTFNKSCSMPEYKYEVPKKLFRCTVDKCRVQMQNDAKIQYHYKCHNETTFKCPECEENFQYWKTLVGHLWRSHQIDMELLKCDQCEYRTHSYSKLVNQHRLSHGEERPFVCNQCTKAFKNMKQLRNHKDAAHRKKDVNWRESKVGSYACEECGKPFSRRRQMSVHMNTVHKRIKPHVCTFCGYATGSKCALNMHVRRHTREKPLHCDVCDYSTADHNSLRRHKLRHSGDKPYKCPHCDYACIQSSTYKIHVKMKHPMMDQKLLFVCKLCNFRSVSQVLYSGHMFSQHPAEAKKIASLGGETPGETLLDT